MASGEGSKTIASTRETRYFSAVYGSNSGVNTSTDYLLNCVGSTTDGSITKFRKGLKSNLTVLNGLLTFTTIIANGTIPTSTTATSKAFIASSDQCIILYNSSYSYAFSLVEQKYDTTIYVANIDSAIVALASSSTYVSNSNYMVYVSDADTVSFVREETSISYLSSNDSSTYAESYTNNFNRKTFLGLLSNNRRIVSSAVIATTDPLTVSFTIRPKLLFFVASGYLRVCDTSTLNVSNYLSTSHSVTVSSTDHRTFTIKPYSYVKDITCVIGVI